MTGAAAAGLMVTGDPGSQSLLAAYLRRVDRLAPVCWTLWRDGDVAIPTDGRSGLPCHEAVFRSVDRDLLAAALSRLGPRFVLTGSSFESRLESTVWRLAAEQSIPTAAWIDRPGSAELRFREAQPDRVFVADEGDARALESLGFARDRLQVARPTHLLPRRAATSTRRPRGALKLLFVSEPFRSDQRRDPDFRVGFDEVDALRMLGRILAGWRRQAPGKRATVTLRPHPREDPTALVRVARRLLAASVARLQVDAVTRPAELAARHHLVVGMFSTFLVQALAAGRPILSLQPRRSPVDWLDLSVGRGIVPVRSVRHGVSLVASASSGRRLAAQARRVAVARQAADRPTAPDPVLDWIRGRLDPVDMGMV